MARELLRMAHIARPACFAFALAALCVSGPVEAQSSEDLQQCEQARESPGRAIGGCTRIIDSDRFSGSNLAIAYHNRGIARTQLGEYDAAISDLDMAIRVNPRAARAMTSRGIAWHGRGDYERAIADYDAAILLDPRDVLAVNNRGLARYFQGEFALAARDFAQTRQLSQSDAYVAIWSYLARTRNGESVRPEFEQNARELPDDAWPAPVLRAYLGQISPEALLAAAAHSDARKQAEHRCEANYYLGQWHVIRGEREPAVAHFRAAQDQCPRFFLEYTGAAAELKRLK
jgi:lipoprotein NlpI